MSLDVMVASLLISTRLYSHLILFISERDYYLPCSPFFRSAISPTASRGEIPPLKNFSKHQNPNPNTSCRPKYTVSWHPSLPTINTPFLPLPLLSSYLPSSRVLRSSRVGSLSIPYSLHTEDGYYVSCLRAPGLLNF